MHRAGRQMILWKPVVYGHVSPCTMCTNTKVAPRRRTNHSMEPVVYGNRVKILKLHRDGRQIILLKPEVMCGHASPPCCCSSLTDFQSPLEIFSHRVRKTTFLVSFISINLPLAVYLFTPIQAWVIFPQLVCSN